MTISFGVKNKAPRWWDLKDEISPRRRGKPDGLLSADGNIASVSVKCGSAIQQLEVVLHVLEEINSAWLLICGAKGRIFPIQWSVETLQVDQWTIREIDVLEIDGHGLHLDSSDGIGESKTIDRQLAVLLLYFEIQKLFSVHYLKRVPIQMHLLWTRL